MDLKQVRHSYVYPKYIYVPKIPASKLSQCQFTGKKDLLKGSVPSSSTFKVSKMFVVWSCVLIALDITSLKTWYWPNILLDDLCLYYI